MIPSVRSLLGIVGVVAVGVVVTVGTAFGILATSESFLRTVVWAPLVGGIVTGVLSRFGRLGSTLTGGVVGVLVGIWVLVWFGRLVTSTAPTTGGAGLAIAVTFLFVLVIAAVIVVLSTTGAFVGVTIRRAYDAGDDSR